MQIDKNMLVKLLEAFADVSEVLQRELTLYVSLFNSACGAQGLDQKQTQEAIGLARKAIGEKIRKQNEQDYQNFLEKLPQIVDLLASDQDEAFRVLKEWIPKGPPN